MPFDNGVNPEELYIRQSEIVRTYKIHPANVVRDLAVAKITPVKVFGVWMYYRADVDAWGAKRQAAQSVSP